MFNYCICLVIILFTEYCFILFDVAIYFFYFFFVFSFSTWDLSGGLHGGPV